MSKIRLDLLLVQKGFVETRQKAQSLIREGMVYTKGKVLDKPGLLVNEDIEIFLKEKPKYVSRGGYKLEGAILNFNLNVKDLICLDVGSSTGGFVDCLLKFGAKKVYAIDVGKNLLNENLKKDERVILFENLNVRFFKEDLIQEKVDLITIDVSFISLKLVIPPLISILKKEGILLPLFKPQFEVGRKDVGKGGIVKKEEKIKEKMEEIIKFVENLNFRFINSFASPLKGQKGNQEYFLLFKKL